MKLSFVATLLSAAAELVPLALAARGRPIVTPKNSDGSNLLIVTDKGTQIRGLSISYDGGDPFDENQNNRVPTVDSLNDLREVYGVNALHVYLEGNASDNTWEIGHNLDKADVLVQRTRDAGLYLIITIGCNGENGSIWSITRAMEFWDLYGDRYKDETHVFYEAHNEPVAYTPNHWSTKDWNDQKELYNQIREVAPETLILLGSFMSFNGADAAISGAENLAQQGVDWTNAAFAFHGYTGLGSIEDTIAPFEDPHPNASNGGMYPALICTEFWPGDTANGYNEAFESHSIGWLQFEYLGGCDTDLDAFKAKIDDASTAWTPDENSSSWPASGEPMNSLPLSTGLFKFSANAYLRVDPNDGYSIKSDGSIFTGSDFDTFQIAQIGSTNRVHVTIHEQGSPTRYLEARDDQVARFEVITTPSEIHEFIFIKSPTDDIILRAYGGGGHLMSLASKGKDRGKVEFTGERMDTEALAVVTAANTGPIPPPSPPTPTPPPPGPYYGYAQTVPGTITFADFDYGGEGIAYHDSDAVNSGGVYRPYEGVDIQASVESCVPNVGWVATNEWLSYTINVLVAGDYDVTARLAAESGSCSLKFTASSGSSVAVVASSSTGGWQVWQNFVASPLTLSDGEQLLRIDIIQGSCNLLTFSLSSTGGSSSPTSSPTHSPSLRPSISAKPSLSISPTDTPTLSSGPSLGIDCSACGSLERVPCGQCDQCKWQGSCKPK